MSNPGVSFAIPPGPVNPTAVTITATAGNVSGSATLTVRLTGFVDTGNLNTARQYHTATLLNNGMVLIAGGCCANGQALSSAELYNPATGAFTTTGNLSTAREYHTATLLNNGMVLIAGGYNSSGYLASAELYNPTSGTFLHTTGNLNTARGYHTATLLNNGMVLLAGGTNGNALATAELYNPTTGIFTATGNLNTAREYHTATLLSNGMVLMAGGYGVYNPNIGYYEAGAELYSPATGAFTVTGSLNNARGYHTATLLNNGMVLMAGGYGYGGDVGSGELYNPATGTFTATGNLNTARSYHTATLLNNGMVLVTGGAPGPLASAELY
ncbi:MAG: kelch repeat-containing protein [Terriglobia bacterium]|jgi:hypothetical protein